MSAKPALEPALRALLDEARRGLDEHPSPETLVAYHAGELPAEAEEKLRDHLALCPECAGLLLDLVSFAEFDPPEETPTLSGGDVESAWQRMQPRLASREQEAPRHDAEPPRAPVRGSDYAALTWRWRLRTAYALAAALFLCVVGLSVWGLSLEKRLEQGSEPRTDVLVAEIDSERDTTRGNGQEDAIRLRGNRFLLLHFRPGPDDLQKWPEYPEYSAEIRKAAGSPVTSIDHLRMLSDGTFAMELPAKLFPPGAYRVAFYGVNKNHRDPIDTLSFRIAPPLP